MGVHLLFCKLLFRIEENEILVAADRRDALESNLLLAVDLDW